MTARAVTAADLTVSEAQFQAAVIDAARLLGWRAVHFGAARTLRGWATPARGDAEGWPDLVLVRDRVVYAELKAERGRPSPAQRGWAAALQAAGAEVYCWRPSDWARLVEVLRR